MEQILIIVDMQNDFVDGVLGTKEAAVAAERAAAKIKDFNGRIFVTMDTHGQDYLETAEGKKLPVPHCIKMTDGWQLNEKISQALAGKDYRTIEKGTFGSLDLVNEIADIQGSGDVSVELAGLCTDICVVSNALLLKAHFPKMQITVDAGCCAGVTPETHRAALETMKMCQVDIIE